MAGSTFPVIYKEKSFYTPPDIIEKESQSEILKSLLLTWAGCYTKAYGHKVVNRRLKDHIIIYCVDGLGWLELNNKRWIIKKGDFFTCPPQLIHSYGSNNKEPWTKYWIHFRGENAGYYMEMLGLTMDSPILHIGDNVKILSWMHDLFRTLEKGYTHSNLLMATSYLNNILSYINSLVRNKELNKNDEITVEKVITYMLDNINGNLDLDHISAYAGISKYHFVRLFKKITGYTPLNYYIRLKMQKACQLLESSSVKISSIGSALGFNNAYYFSMTFKRVIGQSPQSYREMLR